MFVTSITVVEMTSAFRRKHNRGECSTETMHELLSAFFDDALTDFVVLPMDEALFGWSIDLVLDDDLRTLDSLQLAAALALANDGGEVTFVCADSQLVSVARSRGLDARNPVENG